MTNFRHSRRLLSLFAFLLVVITPVLAAESDKAAKIDRLLTTYHDYGHFNGSALVAENGKVIFKKAYGMANMEWGVPNTPDAKFRLGSVTKQFTSMLVMQQVERGKLRLDSHISDYLPYYRKDTGSKVTLHHLLSHTSGIPNYTDEPNFFAQFSRNPYTPEEAVKKLCSGDLEFEPGTKYKYDNSGYFLLGAILEQVTGKPYEELLQENIFGPVGMKNTGYDHSQAILAKRAVGYARVLSGFENAAYLDMSIPYAAGSLYSTVEDLYLWDQALYGDQLLRADLKALLFKPNLENYGYGWNITALTGDAPGAPGTMISHNGGINGFSTTVIRLVRDRDFIVILDNTRTGPESIAQMSLNLRNVLYGKETVPIHRSLAETLGKTVATRGVEAAIAQYADLKKNSPSEYLFREVELNRLANSLLTLKRNKDAIAIYKLNVAEYPKSPATYNLLAGAYMNDGQKELAIENYNKALAIDPENKNAKRMLPKLTGASPKEPSK